MPIVWSHPNGPTADADTKVDIIGIPAIGANPHETWSAPVRGRLIQWFGPLLHKEIPAARIFLYGQEMPELYDGLPKLGGYLLTALRRERKERDVVSKKSATVSRPDQKVENEEVIEVDAAHGDMSTHPAKHPLFLYKLCNELRLSIGKVIEPVDGAWHRFDVQEEVKIEIHQFYEAGGEDESQIKVWSVSPTLREFLKFGPTQCITFRLTDRRPSVQAIIPLSTDLRATKQTTPERKRAMSVPRIEITSTMGEPQQTLADPPVVPSNHQKVAPGILSPGQNHSTEQPKPHTDPRVPQIVVTPPKHARAVDANDVRPLPEARPSTNETSEDPQSFSKPPTKAPLLEQPRENGAPTQPAPMGLPGISFNSSTFPLALAPDDVTQKEVPGPKKLSKFQLSDLSRRKFKWIHAPSNNTAWVVDLLKTISREKCVHDYHAALLRDKHWSSKHNRARHGSPHAHYLHPMCTVLPSYASERSETVDSETETTRPHVRLAIYLPYLHWDSFRAFKIRAKTIKKRLLETRTSNIDKEIAESGSLEQRLIWQYLPSRQIHCRRTLDQYRYPNLRNTSVRDGDQILYKRTSKLLNAPSAVNAEFETGRKLAGPKPSKKATLPLDRDGGKMLMVDQLWLWILDDQTVVTLFPSKEKEPDDESIHRQVDLRGTIYNELNDDLAPRCENCLDFAALVVQHAVTDFLSPGRRIHEDLQVFRIFEESIGILTELQNRSFKKFRDRSYNPGESGMSRQMLKEYQEDNKRDLTALMELRDVEDELKTIEILLQTQQSKLQELLDEYSRFDRTHTVNGHEILDEALQTVKDQTEQVESMLSHARDAQQAYKDLLDMKQKEQNTDEARQARHQAETATSQSRSVMVFTVFTVIFLPLSFMTSLFGMNVKEWSGDQDNLSARRIFTLIACISFAVILIAFLVAFNGAVRAFADQTRRTLAMSGKVIITGIRDVFRSSSGRISLRKIRRWSQRALRVMVPKFLVRARQRLREQDEEKQVLLENSQQFWHQIANETRATNADGHISQALLGRARSIASEHTRLSNAIAEDFEPRSARRVGELSAVVNALKQWDNANESVTELNKLLTDPSADEDLRSLAAEELPETQTRYSRATQSLATSLIPPHPFAALSCFIEIRPGAGGGEAALFARDLLRMYQAFCARKGLRTSLLKCEDAEGMSSSGGSDAPLQEAILEVETAGAYGDLRCEAGVHRVQRVPATESKGRTHTSAASVMVLPSIPSDHNEDAGEDSWNDKTSDYYVDPQEVRTDVMRASGAGGQHVNKTESAVRLTHLPTGTTVGMQESRSQHKNREKAWRVLRSKLAQARREAREEEMVKLRRSVVGVAKIGRGDKIRTYNWGQQRVTDHRSGLSVHNLDDVVAGGENLEKIMESVRAWLVDREIEGLAVEQGGV
ncbi:MAG: hypothetical protein M1833_005178 [Piccolia ochrophora]|nr:MAG: hypothetical protein M1833_005178 [Piccolia ochrophora]